MKKIVQILLFILISSPLFAQMSDAPKRADGDGPYDRLIIRGVNMIDGTGSPATGPVDIVVEGNKIASIVTVGFPGLPINENRRPKAGANDREIDAEGMLATCIQHEIDHLEGILFIDYLSKLKKTMIVKKLSKQKKELERIVV